MRGWRSAWPRIRARAESPPERHTDGARSRWAHRPGGRAGRGVFSQPRTAGVQAWWIAPRQASASGPTGPPATVAVRAAAPTVHRTGSAFAPAPRRPDRRPRASSSCCVRERRICRQPALRGHQLAPTQRHRALLRFLPNRLDALHATAPPGPPTKPLAPPGTLHAAGGAERCRRGTSSGIAVLASAPQGAVAPGPAAPRAELPVAPASRRVPLILAYRNVTFFGASPDPASVAGTPAV